MGIFILKIGEKSSEDIVPQNHIQKRIIKKCKTEVPTMIVPKIQKTYLKVTGQL